MVISVYIVRTGILITNQHNTSTLISQNIIFLHGKDLGFCGSENIQELWHAVKEVLDAETSDSTNNS